MFLHNSVKSDFLWIRPKPFNQLVSQHHFTVKLTPDFRRLLSRENVICCLQRSYTKPYDKKDSDNINMTVFLLT